MEKQEKVVDASIIVKWFVNEVNSDKTIRIKEAFLRGEFLLAAPDIIISEVLNTLRYKQKKEKELIYTNKMLWELNLKLENASLEMISKAIENSIKYNITIYDSLYVTLAQLHGTFLITGDKELYKIPNVIPLEKV
ncbi:MAG: type II toxin-antitoxin system VapC family toxin [Nanoarchaeota archaeon]